VLALRQIPNQPVDRSEAFVENDSEQLEENEVVTEAEPVKEKTGASSIALTITIVSLILWFGFQSFQLVRDRSSLRLVKANQDTAMQESEKIRAQFQTLMMKTAQLANQGHAGAKMVIDELQKRGVGVGVAPEEKPAEKPESKSKTK
jgi:preprotein translocase subunit SecF